MKQKFWRKRFADMKMTGCKTKDTEWKKKNPNLSIEQSGKQASSEYKINVV